MMAAVAVADSSVEVDRPSAVTERLEAFGVEVLAEAVNRPVQMVNGGVYLRGLLERGPRKSLEPMVARLGGEADYESLQNFLAVSSWDPVLLVRAVAERVMPAIGVQAWVLDDTGFPKDGKHSPGVKRQYTGTLGKIGNCQIGVSVHAVGEQGTVPLGWALYLPEEWCEDPERRRRAKIPEDVEFQTKPELGVDLIEQAAGWEIEEAPVLGDQAYGDNTVLRERLHDSDLQYVLSVGADTKVFTPGTTFTVPDPQGGAGPPYSRPRPDREPVAIAQLIADLPSEEFQTVAFRDGPDGEPVTSRFCFLRVRAANRAKKRTPWPPREEWLIRRARSAERLLDQQPTRGDQARAARAPVAAALEDRARLQTAQGRARPGPLRGTLLPRLASPHRPRYRRTRLPDPGATAPKSPAAGLTLPQAVLLLQPLFKCWTGRCTTCQQTISLDDLPLHPPPQEE
jgi:SRSO17 transposase